MPCFYTSTLPAKIKNKKLEFVPPQFFVCVGRNEQVQTLDYVCLRVWKLLLIASGVKKKKCLSSFCREKRKVFWSCCPPIRRSLALRPPPLLPLRLSRPLLLESCYMALWALTPPLPLAQRAAWTLNLLLLLPRHPPPPQSQSPPIGRAVPLMDVFLSLLLPASPAPLFYLNSMTHVPSYVRGKCAVYLDCFRLLFICTTRSINSQIHEGLFRLELYVHVMVFLIQFSLSGIYTLKFFHVCMLFVVFKSVSRTHSLPLLQCVSFTICLAILFQVQGGCIISSPERSRAGT